LKSQAAFLVLSLAAAGWAQQQPAQDLPQDYNGPALLNRGGEATVVTTAMTKLTPFVSVNGIYDTGLATISTTPQGTLPFASGFGVETSFGVTGQHPWKHSLLSINYNGAIRHYTRNTYYDGIDNSLMFSFKHQATRKLSFEASENAAHYSQSYGLFLPLAAAGQPYSQTFANVATGTMFDTPMSIYVTAGRMTYQQSPRWSFSASGNNFIVRQRSSALIGINGYDASGDAAYRLTRFQTVGLVYSFSYYGFQHMFGSTDVNGLALAYGIRLGRAWEFSANVGGYRAGVSRQQQVAVDPAIAAILGTATATQTFHGSVYMPSYAGRLTRAFHNAAVSANYSRTIVPGNGVFLASGFQGAGIAYSYRGFRRMSVDLSVSYGSYSSLSQSLGTFRDYAVSGGLGYKLSRTMSIVTRLGGQKFQMAGGGPINRNFYRTQLGLAWSPGDYPLPNW
jgi:hypothetical protein